MYYTVILNLDSVIFSTKKTKFYCFPFFLCTLYVSNFSELSILVALSVFSNIYLMNLLNSMITYTLSTPSPSLSGHILIAI
jgi:hypothetical protein